MKAQFKPIRQLLGGRPGYQFEVPDYQRGYEWEEKHLEDLWDDLQRIGDGADFHYFGDIILREIDESNKFEIVDGQQRLVTLSLLLMAIRDSPSINAENDKRFENILDSFSANEKNRKIMYSSHDEFDMQFDNIWKGDPSGTKGDIKDAYDYYEKKVKDLDEQELNNLIDKIVNKLRVVETIADDARISYMIFQSQNERGTEVKPEVLAKARIFGEAERLDDAERRQVIGRWDSIYDQLRRELDGPRFRSDLRVRRPLTQILINSEYETPPQIDKGELYRNFDKILRSHSSTLGFIEWFQEQVDKYLELSSDSYEINSRNLSNGAIRHLQYLNSVSTHSEVLSLAIYNGVNDNNMLKEYFRLASILAIRMELAGYPSATKRDAIYNTARSVREANDVNQIREELKTTIRRYSPTDPEIIEHLKANDLNIRGPWNFRTLLKLVSIEESRRRDRSKLPLKDLHIEHIAPRNTFGNSEYAAWRRALNEEEYDDRRDKLGNLTLLLPSDHSSLDETSFSDKKNTYTNSDIRIAAEVAEYHDWGDDNIEKRTDLLAKELTERWSV